jgi:hypothetical protein
MGERLLSSEVREGLAACDNIRAMAGPMNTDRVEHEVCKLEQVLRHLLNVLVEKQHVVTDVDKG